MIEKLQSELNETRSACALERRASRELNFSQPSSPACVAGDGSTGSAKSPAVACDAKNEKDSPEEQGHDSMDDVDEAGTAEGGVAGNGCATPTALEAEEVDEPVSALHDDKSESEVERRIEELSLQLSEAQGTITALERASQSARPADDDAQPAAQPDGDAPPDGENPSEIEMLRRQLAMMQEALHECNELHTLRVKVLYGEINHLEVYSNTREPLKQALLRFLHSTPGSSEQDGFISVLANMLEFSDEERRSIPPQGRKLSTKLLSPLRGSG